MLSKVEAKLESFLRDGAVLGIDAPERRIRPASAFLSAGRPDGSAVVRLCSLRLLPRGITCSLPARTGLAQTPVSPSSCPTPIARRVRRYAPKFADLSPTRLGVLSRVLTKLEMRILTHKFPLNRIVITFL